MIKIDLSIIVKEYIMTEVLGTDRSCDSFNRVIMIETLSGDTIYGLYDKKQKITVGDIVKSLKNNLQYKNSNHPDFYENVAFRLRDETLYDRNFIISDFIKDPITKIKMLLFYPFKEEKEYNIDTYDYEGVLGKLKKTKKFFQIFVKTLTGKTIIIEATSKMPVEVLKYLIMKKENISMQNMRPLFAGKQLINGTLLEDYKIKKESTISLVLNLRGGMYSETSGRIGSYKSIKGLMFYIDNEFSDLDSE